VVVVLEFLLRLVEMVATVFFQQLLPQQAAAVVAAVLLLKQPHPFVLVHLVVVVAAVVVLVLMERVRERVVLGHPVKGLLEELLERHQQQTSALVAVVVEHRQSEVTLLEMLQETAVMELHLVLPDHLLLMLEAAGAVLETIRMVVGIPLEREVPEVVDSVVV
jgi:hypothetical protein